MYVKANTDTDRQVGTVAKRYRLLGSPWRKKVQLRVARKSYPSLCVHF